LNRLTAAQRQEVLGIVSKESELLRNAEIDQAAATFRNRTQDLELFTTVVPSNHTKFAERIKTISEAFQSDSNSDGLIEIVVKLWNETKGVQVRFSCGHRIHSLLIFQTYQYSHKLTDTYSFHFISCYLFIYLKRWTQRHRSCQLWVWGD
jgi:hypothetical protein